MLDLLGELNREKPVWVELGLQTIHAATARYIRRGWELPVFDWAVAELKRRGVTVIVHVILGLPGETREQILETVDYVGRSGADGVKFQLLHVLDDTDLYADYAAGRFRTLELEEYAALLADCVRHTPPQMVIHRLTGDGYKKHLAAPLWSGDKKRTLNTINQYFREHDVIQGQK